MRVVFIEFSKGKLSNPSCSAQAEAVQGPTVPPADKYLLLHRSIIRLHLMFLML